MTARAGIGTHGDGMGVAVGDYDGDGLMDLYLTALGPNALYRNRGDGTFEDVTARAGVDDPRWSTSAAFADLDADGDLDLFVANYLDPASSGKPCFEPAGARDYCPPTSYRPVPDRLFRNRGDGRFEDVSEAAGILRAYGNGLGVAIGDYDRDGRPDIYVANDATPNQLWHNQGDGRFVDVGPLSGAAFNALGRPEGSMGIASGDPDADGDEDLLVTNIAGETFAMYVNDGRAGFEDRRADVGLAQSTGAMTGFGVAWLDADNDGTADLLAVNGAVTLVPELRGQAVPYRQRNQVFRGVLSRPSSGTAGARNPRFRLEEDPGRRRGSSVRAAEREPRSGGWRSRQRRLRGCCDHRQRRAGARPSEHRSDRPRLGGTRVAPTRAEPLRDRRHGRGRRRARCGQALSRPHRRQLSLGVRSASPHRPWRPPGPADCRHHLARRHPDALHAGARTLSAVCEVGPAVRS